MKTIRYPMTRDYRSNWGCVEAVRELVQNCLDNRNNPSTYTLSIDGTITITTKDYELPMSAFALGESYKESDNSIGRFGEGFKLAMMILTREGRDPYIMFGTKLVEFAFAFDELLGVDVFEARIEDQLTKFNGLTFKFSFPNGQIEVLKERVNVFADDVLPLPNTVDVIEHKPGTVMVNGLFICEEAKFKYGYNFAPTKIELGCDRQIANTFGMAWETSKIWAEKLTSSNADEVLSMMSNDQMDVANISYHLSDSKAKLITEAFVMRFGHVEIKPMGSGLSYGMSVGGGLYNTMRKSGYTKVAKPHEEPNTPYRLLKELVEQEKKHMRAHARRALNKLLEQSKGWKNE